MHIGVNTLFHVPGDVGGTETYLRELLLAIAKEYPKLSITLFTHRDNDSLMREIFDEYDCFSFEKLSFKASSRPLRIIAEQLWLPLRVLRSKVNILWSPGYTAPYFSHCPQVVTVHDLQYKNHADDLTWLERITLNILVKTACKKSRAIIAVSEFSKNEIVKYQFAPKRKVHAILEGVDESFGIAVTSKVVNEELGQYIPADEPFILCVAHTYPHKNVHLLIDAFREIQHYITHNLVIVGKPRLGEPAVEAAVSRLGDNSRLYRLMTGVSFDILKLLYQKADVFVLPSVYEGFGLPVLEAMMAGTPVICAKEASIPEVGGRFAHYVPLLTSALLGQEIKRVLALRNGRQDKVDENSRQWAETFTWRKAARETIGLLSRVQKAD